MASNFPALDQLGETSRARLEQALDTFVPAISAAPRLSQAMRYAALSGGKRIRPLLVYGAAQLAGAEHADLHDCGASSCAVSSTRSVCACR